MGRLSPPGPVCRGQRPVPRFLSIRPLPWSYDSAGRCLGVWQCTYDVLGRQTTVPASDASNPGLERRRWANPTTTCRTVAQNGATTTFTSTPRAGRLPAKATTRYVESISDPDPPQ